MYCAVFFKDSEPQIIESDGGIGFKTAQMLNDSIVEIATAETKEQAQAAIDSKEGK